LPFLRFTRDKRGYETTSLVHAFRGHQGRARQKLLYWFRTPPSVKVGRPALDEEAIRWIEEHNPEIEFDWPKILESTSPPAPLTDEARARRGRRVKTERRGAAPERPAPRRAQPPAPSAPPVKPVKEEALDEPAEADVIAQLLEPDAEEPQADPGSVVEMVVGREQIVRLRARYAELQARITERGGDAAQLEALRAEAEQLNPDSWVTAEEVKNGLAEFEQKIRDLRAALGLRRRRRSRRGGRRRRGGRQGAADQTLTAAPSSNSPGAGTAPTGGSDEDED
jgi:hypothetical protein